MLFRDINMPSTHFFFEDETINGGFDRTLLSLKVGGST